MCKGNGGNVVLNLSEPVWQIFIYIYFVRVSARAREEVTQRWRHDDWKLKYGSTPAKKKEKMQTPNVRIN